MCSISHCYIMGMLYIACIGSKWMSSTLHWYIMGLQLWMYGFIMDGLNITLLHNSHGQHCMNCFLLTHDRRWDVAVHYSVIWSFSLELSNTFPGLFLWWFFLIFWQFESFKQSLVLWSCWLKLLCIHDNTSLTVLWIAWIHYTHFPKDLNYTLPRLHWYIMVMNSVACIHL